MSSALKRHYFIIGATFLKFQFYGERNRFSLFDQKATKNINEMWR